MEYRELCDFAMDKEEDGFPSQCDENGYLLVSNTTTTTTTPRILGKEKLFYGDMKERKGEVVCGLIFVHAQRLSND